MTVEVGDGLPIVDVGFSPKVLSRHTPTPISPTIFGEVDQGDGSLPPELRELALEFDKSIEFHVAGIPVCRKSLLQGTETREALTACRPALIGEGDVSIGIGSAERNDLLPPPRALIFKGGEVGGTTTLFVHLYIPGPLSRAFVLPLKITDHPDGHLGTLAVAGFPRIAGGTGSVLKFQLQIDRTVRVGGVVHDPISATCRDGKLRTHIEARFEDGTRTDEEVIRACTPGP